jgi:hypothetical protein
MLRKLFFCIAVSLSADATFAEWRSTHLLLQEAKEQGRAFNRAIEQILETPRL